MNKHLHASSLDFNATPISQVATIDEAADYLRMSVRHVNDLLDCSRIKFQQIGSERTITWETLNEYKQDKKRGVAALTELVRISQEMGLYDMELEDFDEEQDDVQRSV
ncbi:MAG: excisionase family DNA-binding protein [Planctomycetaceae bacterium]|nr:excisionase family DNA-binding protein [Planctomycetaceae bacterium]